MSGALRAGLCAVRLNIGALLLSIGACGGGGGPPPSYTLIAAALNPGTVTAGRASTSIIKVAPVNGYSGGVSLSCGMVSGGGVPAPSCSLGPSALTISGTTPGTSTLTVSTASGTPGGNYSFSVTAADGNKLAPSNGPQTLTLTTAAVIEHVVVIFQENRTPDNLFHDPVLISRGADIASSGLNSLAQTIQLSPIDLGTAGSNPQNYDNSHAHSAFVLMYDGGKMDGANLIPSCGPPTQCPPNPQFMYVKPADVQPYFALAEQYTFGDRMFQSNRMSLDASLLWVHSSR